MKKKIHNHTPGRKGHGQFISAFWVLYGALLFTLPHVHASENLDRQYAFETIGFLRSWDNTDGLFSEYVASAYKDYFSHQTRFVLNDLSQADPILSRSKIPYPKVVQSPEILGQLARSTRTENILRTQIKQEASQYFFTVDWIHAPRMELLGTIRFKLEGPTDGTTFGADIISGPLHENLDRLFSQVPIIANVTGRDDRSVTVNPGRKDKMKKGDILTLATLSDVKRHPLLKTIVDWNLIPTGKVEVVEVEDGMAFCRILEEEPGKEIHRFQKVIQIQAGPQNPTLASGTPNRDQPSPILKPAEEQEIETPPKLGWASLSLPIGSYSRQFSSPSNSVSNSGSGITLGSNVDGQIWLTREWFVDAGFGYTFWNFSQQDTQSGTLSPASQSGGAGGSMTSFKLDFGYSYLVKGDCLGPKGWIKLGYESNSYSLPASTTEFTGPMSFGSIFLGMGGDIPIRGPWGAFANLNFRVITIASQTWLNESVASASYIDLSMGGYYRLNPRVSVTGGFRLISNDATFSGGSTLGQKTMTIGPSLLYYF